MTNLHRIAIIGAGPMGLSLAAITSAHLPTVLVVRQRERAERIRRAGIRLRGAIGADGHPEVVSAAAELAGLPPVDLLFIATKTPAIPEVCADLRRFLPEPPYVVSYQNGIESGRTVIRMLGSPRVVRMILNYGAEIEDSAAAGEPLAVRITLHAPPHLVGGEGDAAEFACRLAPQIDAMGLPMHFTADIEGAAWRKGIANAAGNPVAALVHTTLGELLESPARALIERLLDEGIAVAQAAGIALGASFRDDALGPMSRGGAHLPSMAADVQAGRVTEITQLNEQIARRGRELGIATPTHDAIIDLIRTFDWRASAARERA